MANMLILRPVDIAAIAVSRGSGAANLLSPSPKEVWVDNAVGTAATIDVDFGSMVVIDTVFLGSIIGPALAARWTITGGLAGYAEFTIKADGPLRVPDRPGRVAPNTHAFWHGGEQLVRYLRVSVTQPAGSAPLAIGAIMAGDAWQPTFNQEWGAGRGVKDTGSVSRLPSGDFVSVEGARYATYKWTLGDLTEDEADWLHDLAMDRGESRVVLVVEDPDWTSGLRARLHYGLLTGLRPNERRNPAQTRWDCQIEDWASAADMPIPPQSDSIMTFGGSPLTFGGEILTIGV